MQLCTHLHACTFANVQRLAVDHELPTRDDMREFRCELMGGGSFSCDIEYGKTGKCVLIFQHFVQIIADS